MPAPYSYDLRRKVIEAIDGGMGKTEASKIFRISRNTINLWLQKREETGDYEAEDGYQRGYGAKIPDLEEFKQFARKHGSQTSIGNGGGMAKRNQRSNYRQSSKEDWIYQKKKLTATAKEMKREEKDLL